MINTSWKIDRLKNNIPYSAIYFGITSEQFNATNEDWIQKVSLGSHYKTTVWSGRRSAVFSRGDKKSSAAHRSDVGLHPTESWSRTRENSSPKFSAGIVSILYLWRIENWPRNIRRWTRCPTRPSTDKSATSRSEWARRASTEWTSWWSSFRRRTARIFRWSGAPKEPNESCSDMRRWSCRSTPEPRSTVSRCPTREWSTLSDWNHDRTYRRHPSSNTGDSHERPRRADRPTTSSKGCTASRQPSSVWSHCPASLLGKGCSSRWWTTNGGPCSPSYRTESWCRRFEFLPPARIVRTDSGQRRRGFVWIRRRWRTTCSPSTSSRPAPAFVL